MHLIDGLPQACCHLAAAPTLYTDSVYPITSRRHQLIDLRALLVRIRRYRLAAAEGLQLSFDPSGILLELSTVTTRTSLLGERRYHRVSISFPQGDRSLV